MLSALPTRLHGAGPAGVAGGAVSSGVEGRQSDQVRCVAGQVGELHPGVWDKNHLDLLTLVLLVPLPVVDLQHRKTLSITLPGFYSKHLLSFPLPYLISANCISFVFSLST